MKKVLSFFVICFVLAGCSSNTKLKEGVGTYTNSNGETITAKVKLENDKLKKVELDETAKDKDKTKKELGNDYNMKQASSIGKEWFEQIDFLENYIEKNGVDKVKINTEGKAINNDVKSGCTINVTGFIKAVQEAEKNAK